MNKELNELLKDIDTWLTEVEELDQESQEVLKAIEETGGNNNDR